MPIPQLSQAMELHQAGELDKAATLYEQLLEADSNHIDALHLLGLIYMDRAHYQEAESLIKKALSLYPDQPDFLSNYGQLLAKMNRLDEAKSVTKKALKLSNSLTHAVNLGIILIQQKNYPDAITIFEQVLQYKPNHIESLRQIGIANKHMGYLDKAITYYEHITALKPDYYPIYNDIGNVYLEQNNLDLALANYKKCLQLNPNYYQVLNNIGLVYTQLNKPEEALLYFEQVIDINPSFKEALLNISNSLTKRCNPAKAIDFLSKILHNDPSHLDALLQMVRCLAKICNWGMLAKYTSSLLEQVTVKLAKGEDATIEPFTSLYLGLDNQLIHTIAKNYTTFSVLAHTPTLSEERHFITKKNPKQLTIGYLSPNFKNHPTAHNMAQFIGHHNKEKFSIHAFAIDGKDETSGHRNLIKEQVDYFHDLEDMSDLDSAQYIYDQKIDILISLMGYTENSRNIICALKPAPIQIHMQSYPGTLGADFIDYFVADNIALPDEHRQYYSEKIISMPHCYFVPNTAHQTSPDSFPTKQECGLPDDVFIFSCFNRSYKIDRHVFECWMNILASVDNSVLWLSFEGHEYCHHLTEAAKQHGIDPKRIIFAEYIADKNKHLARHIHIDLVLDTFIYNAHTTAMDALLMDIPVITLQGKTFATRACSSMLTAIGLEELITQSQEEYINLAIKCATNKGFFNNIQNTLSQNKNTYPLFDTNEYVQSFELALQECYKRYAINCDAQDINVAKLIAQKETMDA